MPIPYSDLSALIALARSPNSPMVSIDEFKGWLVSPRAQELAAFVHERSEPKDELRDDYQMIVALSGVPSAAAHPKA